MTELFLCVSGAALHYLPTTLLLHVRLLLCISLAVLLPVSLAGHVSQAMLCYISLAVLIHACILVMFGVSLVVLLHVNLLLSVSLVVLFHMSMITFNYVNNMQSMSKKSIDSYDKMSRWIYTMLSLRFTHTCCCFYLYLFSFYYIYDPLSLLQNLYYSFVDLISITPTAFTCA